MIYRTPTVPLSDLSPIEEIRARCVHQPPALGFDERASLTGEAVCFWKRFLLSNFIIIVYLSIRSEMTQKHRANFLAF